ncbi:MAG: Clp protease N-terminal domain-containing protein [Gaiellaceae bacterium]
MRDRLLELAHEQERAQADLHHAIRRLHAAGGSLREIADELGLSHQRVHQIVGADASPRRRGGHHGRGWGVRFTRVARAVVTAAGDEARALGHDRIGTEHLALGAFAVEEGGAHRVLADAGIEPAKLREAVVAAVGEGGEPGRRRLPFTRAAKRALERALVEAERLQSRFVGSEHVLLGVLEAEGSGGRGVLESAGADPAALREATLALLRA